MLRGIDLIATVCGSVKTQPLSPRVGRRTVLKSAGLLAGAAILPASRLVQILGDSAKPQRFQLGFAPATDGTLDSYWARMKALSETGLRNIEIDNGALKLAENYAAKPAEFRDRMAKLNLRLVGVNQPYQFPDPAAAASIKEKNAQIGKFLRDVGAIYLGWEGGLAPAERKVRPAAKMRCARSRVSPTKKASVSKSSSASDSRITPTPPMDSAGSWTLRIPPI